MPVDRYQFGHHFYTFSHEFAKLERTLCRKAGLYSGQPRVLTMLKDNEGCTLSMLSELCGIGMPSLSVSVRNMEKSGLIRKGSTERDSRAQLLYLTDPGREKAELFHTFIDAFFKELLEFLGEPGSLEADTTLLRVNKYLKKINGCGEPETVS